MSSRAKKKQIHKKKLQDSYDIQLKFYDSVIDNLNKMMADAIANSCNDAISTTSTYSTNTTDTLTMDKLNQIIDLLPQRKKVYLSNYIPTDNDEIFTCDDITYITHPDTARKLLEIDPSVINYIENIRLLEESEDT